MSGKADWLPSSDSCTDRTLESVAADYSLDPDEIVAARFFESKFAA